MNDVSKLTKIMEQLRDPKKGCPWDLEQNFSTIAPHTIEEAYEVVDAIEHHDMEHLREELGDLLFQVVFHSQLAKEAGHFNFDDVVEAIATKMIFRHPHIFGDQVIETAKEQEHAWELFKQQERSAKGVVHESVLEGVPVGLPSMIRAVKLQKKAAKVGFDWPDVEGAFGKLREEIEELQEEIKQGMHHSKVEEELGDVLFSLLNVARKLKIDPDAALRGTNRKFETRFSYMEKQLKARGTSVDNSDLATMDALWDEAKKGGA
jgi:MazG family protein